MAFQSVSAPYGMVPIGLIGGQNYAGAVRHMKIASAYNTSIFSGDVVKRVAAGGIEKDTGTTTATPVGVFMGCTYTDPNSNQKVFKKYFPADTAASDIEAYVVDDPDALFKIVSCSATTTVAGIAVTCIGNNASIIQNAGSATTGQSKIALTSGSIATTLSLPLRIVDVVPETTDTSGNYTEVIVKWNAPYNAEGTPNTTTGGHFYHNPIGI